MNPLREIFMKTPIVTKVKNKLVFTPAQATFNRHRKKIDKIRAHTEALKIDLEKALERYYSELLPFNREISNLITNFLFELMNLTKDPKALKKNQRKILENFIEDDVILIFNLIPHTEVHEEIKKLHEKISGMSSKEMFEDEGLGDVDFSELDPDDDLNDIMEKIAKATCEARDKQENTSQPPPKTKTKKELLKEQKAMELEALQNKSLSTIYKELAKELHPDLEQNPQVRKEKEEIMKRLTAAYDNKDLTTLLVIRSEWVDNESGSASCLSEETFKVYNSILKDQIKKLQFEHETLFMNPRYIEIFPFVSQDPLDPLGSLTKAHSESQDIFNEYTQRMSDIKGPGALKNLKKILDSKKEEIDFIDDMEAKFLDFIFSTDLEESFV
jgi:hypothetical protein